MYIWLQNFVNEHFKTNEEKPMAAKKTNKLRIHKVTVNQNGSANLHFGEGIDHQNVDKKTFEKEGHAVGGFMVEGKKGEYSYEPAN